VFETKKDEKGNIDMGWILKKKKEEE